MRRATNRTTTRRALELFALLLASAAGVLAQGSITVTTTSPLPAAYLNVPYGPSGNGFQFTATASPPTTITWSVVTDAPGPPPGMSLSSSGLLTGTPTSTGTYTFQVQASGTPPSAYVTGGGTFTITVNASSITITTAPSLPDGIINQFYGITFSATSTPPGSITWLFGEGPAPPPPGLTLSSSGVLSGTPTQVGLPFTFTVVAELTNTSVFTSTNFTVNIYAGQVVITTKTLPPAPVGQAYSAQLAATPANATWALIANLPPGITFDTSTGVLSGTPSAPAQAYPLSLNAFASSYLSGQGSVTLYTTNGPLQVKQTSLPEGTQNVNYSATLTPTGGLAPFTWSAGSNAAGLSIGPGTGVLTGTPHSAGSFNIPVTLTDAAGETALQNLTLVVALPLSVTTTALPNGAAGTAYPATQLTVTGGQSPYTWTLASNSPGPLPPGLTLSTTGSISGTPTANGVYSFLVQVTDAAQRTGTQTLSITIGGGLTISTSVLPDAVIGTAYSQTLAAANGTPPYTWKITSGSLPSPLKLDPATGAITGTAPTLGGFNFTVQVTDSTPGPAPQTSQKAFTLNVSNLLTISTTSLPGGAVGTAYSQLLQESGGRSPYTWSVLSGSLPAGLQLNPGTGAISGTPTGVGSQFTVQVADAGGQLANRALTIEIGGGLTVTSGSFTATVGAAFSQALVTGGTAPYTLAVSNGGSLPSWLTFAASTGVLSGTPTAAGSFGIGFTITDSKNQTGSGSINITVAAATVSGATIGTITPAPAQQPAATIKLANPYPADITVTFSLSFQSSVGGSAQDAQLIPSSGNLILPAGQTQVSFPNVLMTGTVAGTITLTAKLTAGGVDVTPNPPPTQTIVIPKAPPVIQSVKFSNTGGSLTVTVTGYSTTRDMTSGSFTFAAASGNTLTQSTISVPLTSAYTTWYQSAASNMFGSQFQLTVPFSVSANASGVASVSVTLTNSQGTSAAATP